MLYIDKDQYYNPDYNNIAEDQHSPILNSLASEQSKDIAKYLIIDFLDLPEWNVLIRVSKSWKNLVDCNDHWNHKKKKLNITTLHTENAKKDIEQHIFIIKKLKNDLIDDDEDLSLDKDLIDEIPEWTDSKRVEKLNRAFDFLSAIANLNLYDVLDYNLTREQKLIINPLPAGFTFSKYSSVDEVIDALKEFPEWLTDNKENLSGLTQLEITWTSLGLWPHILCSLLTNLTSLNLTYSSVIAIPAEIGKLQNLTHLNLSHNDLTSVPGEIGKIQSLEHLDLSYNWLSEVPEEIWELKNISHLFLNTNELTNIQLHHVKKLTNLSELNISCNQLNSTLELLTELKHIKFFCDPCLLDDVKSFRENLRKITLYISKSFFG